MPVIKKNRGRKQARRNTQEQDSGFRNPTHEEIARMRFLQDMESSDYRVRENAIRRAIEEGRDRARLQPSEKLPDPNPPGNRYSEGGNDMPSPQLRSEEDARRARALAELRRRRAEYDRMLRERNDTQDWDVDEHVRQYGRSGYLDAYPIPSNVLDDFLEGPSSRNYDRRTIERLREQNVMPEPAPRERVQGASRHTPSPVPVGPQRNMTPYTPEEPIPDMSMHGITPREFVRMLGANIGRTARAGTREYQIDNALRQLGRPDLSGAEREYYLGILDRAAATSVRRQGSRTPRTADVANRRMERNAQVRAQAEHLYNTGRVEEAQRMMRNEYHPEWERDHPVENPDPRQRKQGGRITRAIAKRNCGGRKR